MPPRPKHTWRIANAIKANINALVPRDWREIAQELDIPLTKLLPRVADVERRLKQPKDARGRRMTGALAERRRHPEVSSPADLGSLLELAEGTTILTTDELLKVASYVALNGKDSDRLMAAKVIRDLQPPEKARLGPPPPTNEEEQIQRLALLLASATPEQRTKALELAATLYTTSEAPPNAQVEAPEPAL